LVQLNGDNRADYVKIFPDGSVRAALNTRSADGRIHWVDQGIIAPGVGQPGEAVRFADMNGDGLDDYVIVGTKGSVWAFLKAGRWEVPLGSHGPHLPLSPREGGR
jgi:hypothetical protein